MKIIEAKLSPPLFDFDIIYREDIIDKIIQNAKKSIIAIIGSPGSGKTTIAYQFIKKIKKEYLWYTLDKKDNSNDTFLSYLYNGLCSKNLLEKGSVDYKNIDNMPNVIINNFKELKTDFYIIIDGFDYIDNREIIDNIYRLIIYSPPRLHIIVISQKLPEFNIPRLLVNNKAFVIKDTDLRLREKDIKNIFKIYNLECNDETAARLKEITGGWLSGVKLLLDDYPISEDTYNSNLEEYFNYQVFNKLSSKEKKILLISSLFDLFTLDLISYISDIKNVQNIVAKLYKSNILLEKRGENLYKLNALFAKYLSKILNKTYSKKEINILICKAGDFLADTNPELSINYYLTSKKYKKAAELIHSYVKPAYMEVNKDLIKNWVYRFDRNVIKNYPQIMHFKESIARWEHDYHTFQKVNKEIKERFKKTRYYYIALYEEATFGLLMKKYNIAEKNIKEIIDNIDKNDVLVTAAYNAMAIMYMQRYMNDKAIEYYLKAEKVAYNNKQMSVYNYIRINRLTIEVTNGNYEYAEKELKENIKDKVGYSAIFPYLQLARIRYLKGKYSKSVEFSRKALSNAKMCDYKLGIVQAYTTLYFAYLFGERFNKARKNIDKAISIIKMTNDRKILTDILFSKLLVELIANDYIEVRSILDYIKFNCILDKEGTAQYTVLHYFTLLARGLIDVKDMKIEKEIGEILPKNEPVYFIYEYLKNMKSGKPTYTINDFININNKNIEKGVLYNEAILIVELLIKHNSFLNNKQIVSNRDEIFELYIMKDDNIYRYNNSQYDRISFHSKIAKLLFYYFIFNKNTIVPREKIIDAFWPEKDYNEAGHLLRDYIYMIKKAFNNNKIIVYSDKGYKLSSDINWEIDYYRMKEKYNTADVARKNNSIDDALKYIGEGLSLCNYFPLQDSYYDWSFYYKNEIEELYLKYSIIMVNIYINTGEMEKAENALIDLKFKFPLEEIVYQQMMNLYLKQGRKGRIRKVYNELRDKFAQELSLNPTEKTENLYRTLISK